MESCRRRPARGAGSRAASARSGTAKETRRPPDWRIPAAACGGRSCDTCSEIHGRNPVQFSIRALSPEKAKTGCLVLAVQGGENLPRAALAADKAAKGALRRAPAGGDLPEE